MSDTRPAPPAKRKNAFNNPKLRLQAPNPMLKGVYATLGFDFYQNNPRLVVDTKDPNLSGKENGYGRFSANLDTVVFTMLLECISAAIASKEPMRVKLENNNHEYVDGKRSQEITHLTDVWVGRDQEGHIFIQVLSTKGQQWPSIKFIFGPSDTRYHKFYKEDGSAWSRAELSVLAARAYVRLLTGLLPVIADTHYYEAPQNNSWGGNKGGGGGGNYRGNGGGGGGYQQRQPAPAAAPAGAGDGIGDDIPW
jgi:hypothetical protein